MEIAPSGFQITFEFLKKRPFYIAKPIRLIELFGGIGAQAKALDRLGVCYEHHRVCELDKFAVRSYNAIHGTSFTPSDIRCWQGADLDITDTGLYCYIMTYSFPCTDISLAGKHEGMAKGSGTRSGLIWEVERLLLETKQLPQVLLMENVPQIHGKKNMACFMEWVRFLEQQGYSNYWDDLNAKDYGIPQSRKRTFLLSLLGDYQFTFPSPVPLRERLIDRLENDVGEQYYLSAKAMEGIKRALGKKHHPTVLNAKSPYTPCIIARIGAQTFREIYIEPSIIEIANLHREGLKNYNRVRGSVVSAEGLSPSIRANSGGGDEIKVYIPKTVLRKLTPLECFRLMDFDDDDFHKAKQAGLSNTQLYKQAGNSICVGVLEAIFRQLNIENIKDALETARPFFVGGENNNRP